MTPQRPPRPRDPGGPGRVRTRGRRPRPAPARRQGRSATRLDEVGAVAPFAVPLELVVRELLSLSVTARQVAHPGRAPRRSPAAPPPAPAARVHRPRCAAGRATGSPSPGDRSPIPFDANTDRYVDAADVVRLARGTGRPAGGAGRRRDRRDARPARRRRAAPARDRAPDVGRVRGLHGRRDRARRVHPAPRNRRRGLRDHLRRPARRGRGEHPRGGRHRPRPPPDRVPSRRVRRATTAVERAASSTAGVVVDIQADVIPSFSGYSVGGGLTPPARRQDDDPDRARAARRPAGVRRRGRGAGGGAPPGARAPARDRRRHRRPRIAPSVRGSSPRSRSTATSADADDLLRRLAERGARRRGPGPGDRLRGGRAVHRARRRGPGRPGLRAVVRVRPDGRRPRGPPGRRLRAVAAAGRGCRSGTTGVIRRAERNSDIVAVADVDVVVIPGEVYARAWLRPLTAGELVGAAAAAGQRMTLSTIERVVALHRVGLFADVPGRTLAALAQRAREVEVRRRRASSSRRAPSRTTCSRSCAGALRVHRGDETVGDPRARRDGGRAGGARARAARRVGDGARADDAAADRQAAARRAARRPARARARHHRRARRDGPRASRPVTEPTDPDRHVTARARLRSRGAVRWLTAQAVVFGAMAALLGVVANAMFLDAYGAGVAAGDVHRDRRRRDRRVGRASRGRRSGSTSSASRSSSSAPRPSRSALAWVIARGGSARVGLGPAPGPVPDPHPARLRVHRRAGRAGILDIAGIKASFPRIIAGFPVGAVLGGLLGGQLVAWLGRTEDLLLATAARAGARSPALVWATGRRYAARLAARRPAPATGERGAPTTPPPGASLRRLLGEPVRRPDPRRTRCCPRWAASSPTTSSSTARPPSSPIRRTWRGSSPATPP